MTTLRSLIDTQAPGRQAPLFETRQGNMELLVDVPGAPLKGIALIAHPQPLLGGSARHKIPFSLARALSDDAWLAIRPNFRGVGRSEGEHDQGEGESDDLLYLVHALRDAWPALPIARTRSAEECGGCYVSMSQKTFLFQFEIIRFI